LIFYRGIDEGKDLPSGILESIFDEIQSNEIIMKEEHETKKVLADPTLKNGATQFTLASANMAMKTEAMISSLSKSGKSNHGNSNNANGSTASSQFIYATHYAHVKAMYQMISTFILDSLVTPLMNTEDMEIVNSVLEGFRYAMKLTCLFDLDVERKQILSAIGKATQVKNPGEASPRHLESIRCLSEIALSFGNYVGDGWMDVVLAINQLEKIQQFKSDSSTR
jgi:brefeldin A-inhibited guanine nucleotide-exchange protein